MSLKEQLAEIEIELHKLEKRIAVMRAAMVPPTVRYIIEIVADYYGLKTVHLLSIRRLPALCRARHIAMYLAMELTAKSYPIIGRAFGDRDHSTVLSGIKKIKDQLATDPKLGEEIEWLKGRIEGSRTPISVAA